LVDLEVPINLHSTEIHKEQEDQEERKQDEVNLLSPPLDSDELE